MLSWYALGAVIVWAIWLVLMRHMREKAKEKEKRRFAEWARQYNASARALSDAIDRARKHGVAEMTEKLDALLVTSEVDLPVPYKWDMRRQGADTVGLNRDQAILMLETQVLGKDRVAGTICAGALLHWFEKGKALDGKNEPGFKKVSLREYEDEWCVARVHDQGFVMFRHERKWGRMLKEASYICPKCYSTDIGAIHTGQSDDLLKVFCMSCNATIYKEKDPDCPVE